MLFLLSSCLYEFRETALITKLHHNCNLVLKHKELLVFHDVVALTPPQRAYLVVGRPQVALMTRFYHFDCIVLSSVYQRLVILDFGLEYLRESTSSDETDDLVLLLELILSLTSRLG